MAEASCSGGTPFKHLIDHQNRDVSHHQDRLLNRPGGQSHGSFRSATQPAQGQDGFNNFMNGPSNLPGLQHHAAGRLAAHAAALGPAHHSTMPVHQTPQFHNSALPASDLNNWAADFSRFQSQVPRPGPAQSAFPQPASQMHQTPNFRSAFAQPNNAFSPMYVSNGGFMNFNAAPAQRTGVEADFNQEMSSWMASNGDGRRMEDVDAVMEQIARDLEISEAASAGAALADTSLSQAETAAQAQEQVDSLTEEIAKTTALDTPPVENFHPVTAEEITPEEKLQEPNGKSEVAEAAERLLESVQHEDGEKWKNSVFLSLMRDFRDGRKDIVDNEIRETDATATTTAESESDAYLQPPT